MVNLVIASIIMVHFQFSVVLLRLVSATIFIIGDVNLTNHLQQIVIIINNTDWLPSQLHNKIVLSV